MLNSVMLAFLRWVKVFHLHWLDVRSSDNSFQAAPIPGVGGGYICYMGMCRWIRVWFSGIPVFNRVYNSRVCVLNRVFISWISSMSPHGVMFKALYWYLRFSLEQGPKSKRIFWGYHVFLTTLLNRVRVSVSAAHPHSITNTECLPRPPSS